MTSARLSICVITAAAAFGMAGMIGCAPLAGPHQTYSLAAAPHVELGESQVAAVTAEKQVVRAQSGDYGYNTYGGRPVGATSPAARNNGLIGYPNSPGAQAWEMQPGGQAPRVGTVPSSVPASMVRSNPNAPIYPPGNYTSPPANYASPSFTSGTVTNRPADGSAAPGGPYSAGSYGGGPYVGGPYPGAAAPRNAFPGTVQPAPGLNPQPGTSAQGDPAIVFPTIDIDILANETRTGRLMVGAGINSDAGLVGQFVIDEQNFDWRRFPRGWDDIRNGYAWRGGGQRFRFEAMPGTEVHRYLVSIQEPYLFDTPFTLGLSGFFYDRRFYDWDESRLGGRVALGYQFPRDWTATVSFRGEDVEITDPRVVPAVQEVAEVLGSNTLMGVKFSVGHDTRDDAFLPTQGHVVELGYEQVFGDFQYPIYTVEARKFFTLTERIDGSGRHVLHIGGQAGWAGDDAPVYDHFYAGGYATIRGFGFRGASPKNGDVIVGGEFQLLGTAEYMFPITADDMLRGVVFCDAGTVEERHKIEWDDFRVAPGFGLRISNGALGPAPIALDLAFPIAREDGDKIRNFSFFIGLRY